MDGEQDGTFRRFSWEYTEFLQNSAFRSNIPCLSRSCSWPPLSSSGNDLGGKSLFLYPQCVCNIAAIRMHLHPLEILLHQQLETSSRFSLLSWRPHPVSPINPWSFLAMTRLILSRWICANQLFGPIRPPVDKSRNP